MILLRRWASAPWAVYLIAFAICVISTFIRGQDANWDQRNYHFYDVYALFHGRMHIDVAPAQLQSWYNPFSAIPYYLCINYLPPPAATIIFASVPALAIALVYLVTRACLLAGDKGFEESQALLCWLAALGALTGPLFLSEVGTTFVDDFSAVLVLAALLILFKGRFCIRSYFFAGLMLGVVLDIKITNAAFVLGWATAVVVVEKGRFVRPLLASGIGAAASYVPVGGAWLVYMYSIFRNPLFPYYNNVFRSSAYWPIPLIDTRFRPPSFAVALSYFPKWVLGSAGMSSEVTFRDVRFLLALLLLILALPQVLKLLLRSHVDDVAQPFLAKPSAFILVFVCVSFAVWLGYSGISRYAIPLESLAVLVIFITLALLAGGGARFKWAAIMTVVLVAGTSHPADWGRTSFSGTWFGLKIPGALKSDGILYVMLSDDPFAFVIPFFPATDVFVRLEGNMPLSPGTGLGQLALAKIASHKGEIRSLSPAGYDLENSASLKAFGLAMGPGSCLSIASKSTWLESCPLVRVGNS